MNNPWIKLPLTGSKSFILPDEQEQIALFNSKVGRAKIIAEQLPGPYLGNPKKASIVMLSLNPGYNSHDTELHGCPEFSKLLRANLLHKEIDYPFYYLSPFCKGKNCGGYKYWYPRLKNIIDEVQNNMSPDDAIRHVAKSVSVIEWFPYHSEIFYYNQSLQGLASQKYSIELAKEALDRQKLIILLRGYSYWERELDSLSRPNIITHKRGKPPRNWYLTKENLGECNFNRILEKLKNSKFDGD